jgi:hypothetical protein
MDRKRVGWDSTMSNHTDTLYQNGSATRWRCNHVKRKYRGIIEPSVPYEGSILKKQYNIQTRKEIKTMFHSILCRFLSWVNFTVKIFERSFYYIIYKGSSQNVSFFQTKLVSFGSWVVFSCHV